MKLLETPDATAEDLITYSGVLGTLSDRGHQETAETLAWTAVESLADREDGSQALKVAGRYLLALAKSKELRGQVADLFRKVHAGREGLDALLEEAGIAGGRPVRRALRTLDVCLAVGPGDYLTERDEDGAARVDAIDTDTWRFTIDTGGKTETLGAVELADQYQTSSATDFRVMRRFEPDEFRERLTKQPAAIVVDLCRQNGGQVDSDRLEAMLVPELIDYQEWKKWWTRARTALRKLPNVRVEGRNPYTIGLADGSADHEEELREAFSKEHDPCKQLALVEEYIADCTRYKVDPCSETLRSHFDRFVAEASRISKKRAGEAFVILLIARRLGEKIGIEGAADPVVHFLSHAEDTESCFASEMDDRLVKLGLTSLVEARPADWITRVVSIFTKLPLAGCEKAATMLVEAGQGAPDFAEIIKNIQSAPVEHNEALLWLWDGSSVSDVIDPPPAGRVLGRILHALEECQRSDSIPREVTKVISARCRAVLSARKYNRFSRFLAGLDRGKAMALKRQISRSDLLGRTVPDDLTRLIGEKYPDVKTEAEVPLWEQEDVIYVSESGMARRHTQIEHHINVKLRENSKAIGEAAAKGDLSENSEYKFALEERDLLRGKLAQMNREMEVAKILLPEQVPTDHIGIGSKAVLRRITDGQIYELTISNSWEADPHDGRINYKAPLAQQVLGSKVGETVQFDFDTAKGEYEVVSLENTLADDADSAPTPNEAQTSQG